MACGQCGAKKGHLPGCPIGEGSRREKKQKRDESKAGKCKHPRTHTDWNRQGMEYRECNSCSAFLGFTGNKRKRVREHYTQTYKGSPVQ